MNRQAAKKAEDRQGEAQVRTLLHVLTLLVAGTLLAGCEDQYEQFEMPTDPMTPTYPAGAVVTVDKHAYQQQGPQRWDVIVFRLPRNPDQFWMLRVVGLPGETISYVDGELLIDGQPPQAPPELNSTTYGTGTLDPDVLQEMVQHPMEVPKDAYYVLGDNTAGAHDSRFWGTVPRDLIVGRVVGTPSRSKPNP